MQNVIKYILAYGKQDSKEIETFNMVSIYFENITMSGILDCGFY